MGCYIPTTPHERRHALPTRCAHDEQGMMLSVRSNIASGGGRKLSVDDQRKTVQTVNPKPYTMHNLLTLLRT